MIDSLKLSSSGENVPSAQYVCSSRLLWSHTYELTLRLGFTETQTVQYFIIDIGMCISHSLCFLCLQVLNS